jgi:hypothetical protein
VGWGVDLPILLPMVAAVTVAADPILVLGPAFAWILDTSVDWSDILRPNRTIYGDLVNR